MWPEVTFLAIVIPTPMFKNPKSTRVPYCGKKGAQRSTYIYFGTIKACVVSIPLNIIIVIQYMTTQEGKMGGKMTFKVAQTHNILITKRQREIGNLDPKWVKMPHLVNRRTQRLWISLVLHMMSTHHINLYNCLLYCMIPKISSII